MRDYANDETERSLIKLEKRIALVYSDAENALRNDLERFKNFFIEEDEKMLDKVKNGDITDVEYKTWRAGKILRSQQLQDLENKVAQRMYDANTVAMSYVNDNTPSIYSLNRNWENYNIETTTDASFMLWNEQAVKRLIVEQPDLLPNYPEPVSVDKKRDVAYNQKQVRGAVTSGIIRGTSIPKIAQDIASRTHDTNMVTATRAARTATTHAQNAGRQDSYVEAEKMGIKLVREWFATLDNRTRHAHGLLDGQTVGVNEPFEVDGYEIMFPGDPSAPGYLVYNCRCRVQAHTVGIDDDAFKRQTYQEWFEEKTGQKR